MKNNVVAIIPAAGFGRRFGEGTNKPFATLGEKPLLLWAVETLHGLSRVHEIIPVVKEADLELCSSLFEEYPMPKIRRIALGGSERQDSVFNGLQMIEDEASVVLVHDGVRPFIDAETVEYALKELKDCEGVVVGVPVKDTVKEVRGGLVFNTPKRDLFWLIQTPQIFHFQALYAAYEKGLADSFYTTDDSALVERNGGTVKVVPGSYMNIKVTTPEDLSIAEVLLGMRNKVK